MSADQIAAFLKRKLEQRCKSLTDCFRKLDKSNTGFLSADDFEATLRDFNIRITRQALAAVVAKYDVNGDGFVSYQEFCVVMSGGQPSAALKKAPGIKGPGAAEAVDRAEANLRRIMYAATSSLTQAFLHLNRNRSGFVGPGELAKIFKDANLELSKDDLRTILQHYDTNKDGKISLVELSKALQADVKRYEGYGARGQKRPRQ